MRKLLFLGAALALLLPNPATAHRLDEYLQATVFSVEQNHVRGTMRLVPGVAVSATVIGSIDTNHDGAISEAEGQVYAQRVLQDLVLRIDSQRVSLHLASISYPSIEEIKEGIGEIQLDFTADLPLGTGNRKLVFENHHHAEIAAYLVNCLVPRDKDIQIISQNRNENQSVYQLNFMDGAAGGQQNISFSGFATAFRLGMRHISEGADHLLFLLTLLLSAPLLATCGKWGQGATVRRSLIQILRIITAFTLGHSLTLAVAAFGLVHLPSRPIEVLIAISILISAIHAIRPMFPGREAAIAAFFGLIHGMAFASVITELGLTGWYRLISILGFNVGIETMQLAVVAATLPSLLLLSRTHHYFLLRITGALFAVVASAAWIIQRLFEMPNIIDPLMAQIAQIAPWIAASVFLLSVLCWRYDKHSVIYGELQKAD